MSIAYCVLLENMPRILCGKVGILRLIAMENSDGFSYNICSEVHLLSGSGSSICRVYSALTEKLQRRLCEWD